MKYSELVAKTMTAETYPKERVIELLKEAEEVQKKEILWSVEDRINWHRTECRFSKNCSTCEVLFYIKKQIEGEEK